MFLQTVIYIHSIIKRDSFQLNVHSSGSVGASIVPIWFQNRGEISELRSSTNSIWNLEPHHETTKGSLASVQKTCLFEMYIDVISMEILSSGFALFQQLGELLDFDPHFRPISIQFQLLKRVSDLDAFYNVGQQMSIASTHLLQNHDSGVNGSPGYSWRGRRAHSCFDME
ncbi:hypothetical protein BWQ96_10550 [Gracilariopsis chorda]|uniref:Uncharacterized protein n=1 Tax=Gracilariopsis chorda TaxID=448386 RepID=A0A2V3ICB7_9FLOR|nr:hypothetical protein BWQ96_10550 [Gracilariopsis chorda]|eukprot:PXF39746.1 hypothetical protein BWQ96_10550 [Gracilariopsis chorda]